MHTSTPLVFAILALASVTPSIAQDANARVGQQGETLVLEANGHRITTGVPAWFSRVEGMSLKDTEVIISGDDNSTRFEIVPKGENAQQWTSIFGVRIVLEPERKLTDYRQAAAYGYALSCKGETGAFYLADVDSDTMVAPMIFACGEFVPEAKREGQGELMSMAFLRSEAGIAVVYEEIRTPNFNGKVADEWPVPGEVMISRAQELLADASLDQL